MSMRALEFYSGIGGLHLGLKRSNVAGSVVRAFDFDQTACQVYEANYGPDIVKKVDVTLLSANDLMDLQANLWLMSPSCQPYTVLNPSAKGAADPRAKSFLHLIEHVLPELASRECHPPYLLVENVAGFEISSTRQALLKTLKSLGYKTLEFLLTPLQFGIPNSRLRYYLLAKASPLHFHCYNERTEDKIWRHIPGRGKDWSDPRSNGNVDPSKAVQKIRDYLDRDLNEGETQPHRIPDRVLEKWGRLFDIVLPSSRRTCCFTRGYTQLVERAGSILQVNEELDTTATFDAFLKAQAEGDPEAVRVLYPLQLRYFSPTELLRLFHFETRECETQEALFAWPPGVGTRSKYRLIGNSVNVGVVAELTSFLLQ